MSPIMITSVDWGIGGARQVNGVRVALVPRRGRQSSISSAARPDKLMGDRWLSGLNVIGGAAGQKHSTRTSGEVLWLQCRAEGDIVLNLQKETHLTISISFVQNTLAIVKHAHLIPARV